MVGEAGDGLDQANLGHVSATVSLRDSVLESVAASGIATLDGSDTRDLSELAVLLGEVRSGWSVLRSRAGGAEDWSLSGTFGHGSFPWHTDGAMVASPPRYIILHCRQATWQMEPTHVLNLSAQDLQGLVAAMAPIVLRASGRSGRIRYLPAVQRSGASVRARWDERTCVATDPVLHAQVERMLECAEPTSLIRWRAGLAAVISNESALHRRPAVSKLGSRVLHRLYVY